MDRLSTVDGANRVNPTGYRSTSHRSHCDRLGGNRNRVRSAVRKAVTSSTRPLLLCGVVPQVGAEGELAVRGGGQEPPVRLQGAAEQEGADFVRAVVPLGQWR